MPESSSVVGTVHLVGRELQLHIRPAADPIPLHPSRAIESRPEPTTLSHLGFMRYVGPLTAEESAETQRIIDFCQRHPYLAMLTGWNRKAEGERHTPLPPVSSMRPWKWLRRADR